MPVSRLRLWFSLEVPVDRQTYLRNGAGLMAAKYATDAALVWLTTGKLWSPVAYLNPIWTMRQQVLGPAPDWLMTFSTSLLAV